MCGVWGVEGELHFVLCAMLMLTVVVILVDVMIFYYVFVRYIEDHC